MLALLLVGCRHEALYGLRWHAIERARLEKAGTPIPFADGMIAAVAARFGLVVVTHDTRDFERFSGVSIVDWMGS